MMKEKTIWIVDDEPAICWSLKRALEREHAIVRTFANAEETIEAIRQPNAHCDVLITDLRLPRADGFAVVDAAKKTMPFVPVIMITAFGDLATAVEAMRASVVEYLPKPFDLDDAKRAITKALSEGAHQATSATDYTISMGEALLLGTSKRIKDVYKSIAVASRSSIPVLLSGPEGAPLESVASAIHRNSSRFSAPFLSLIPDAIALQSLDRELVGVAYDSGSSNELRTGIFGLAGTGTLYISEVADLPASSQQQLLRVLEDSTYTPFGSSESIRCLARVIAATSRELEELVQTGEFSSDLEQRLRLFPIHIPSLNHRREDVIPIAQAVLTRCTVGGGLILTEDAKRWLVDQEWPGDVRELRNVVEKAASLRTQGTLDAVSLSAAYRSLHDRIKRPVATSGIHSELDAAIRKWLCHCLEQESTDKAQNQEFGMLYDEFLAAAEKPFLEELFRRLHGNRVSTAAKLGMHRSTLRQKMRRYGID